MSTTLIDRVAAIVLHNGVLRIDCVATGPNNEERPSGTLLVPASQVANFINSLAQATQELDKRLREGAEQQAAAAKTPAGNA
jgi:hypothetical protein